MQSSPHPRMVLNLGVIGHRTNRLTAGTLDKIEKELIRVYEGVSDCLYALHASHSTLFAKDDPQLRIVTGLAEGSDQIAAKAALDRKHNTYAVLPFERGDYGNDFAEGESRENYNVLLSKMTGVFELTGDRSEETRAYERMGYELIRRSDIIAAIWDGGPGAGRGGTTEMIKRTLEFGVPVIHIDANTSNATSILMPPVVPLTPDETWIENVDRVNLTGLSSVLKGIALPIQSQAERDLVERYLVESETRFCPRCAYPLLLFITFVRQLKLSDILHPAYVESAEAEWKPLSDGMSSRFGTRSFNTWLQSYAFSDSLGIRFAQMYRSGYVANFILAAIAVLLALLGLIFPDNKAHFVAAELVVIGLIVWNTFTGRRGDWHRRWLDYRNLAERLRLVPFLATLGRLSIPSALFSSATEDRTPGWVGWYARAIERQFPVPNAVCSATMLEGLSAHLAQVIDSQIGYHRANAKRMKHLDHRLHVFGNLLFSATATVCLIFLFTKFVAPDVASQFAKLATVLTAVFPAFGSAVFGIRMHGEFGSFSKQSNTTASELENIIREIESDPPTLESLRSHAEQASRIMFADLADWRHLYEGRPLVLPA